MKLITSIVLIAAIVFALVGCAGMTETQQRTLSGGAIGAAAGAGIAAIAGGSAWTGAALGAAGGAITGYIIGEQHREIRRR
jgi:osmotically inducible lipoprotein OsmB